MHSELLFPCTSAFMEQYQRTGDGHEHGTCMLRQDGQDAALQRSIGCFITHIEQISKANQCTASTCFVMSCYGHRRMMWPRVVRHPHLYIREMLPWLMRSKFRSFEAFPAYRLAADLQIAVTTSRIKLGRGSSS